MISVSLAWATVLTWFVFGILLGWAFAVMMGVVRKSESTYHIHSSLGVDRNTLDAIADGVAERLCSDTEAVMRRLEADGGGEGNA